MTIQVRVVQFPVSLSIRANLEVVQGVLEESQPGDLVLFPEGALSGYAADMSLLQGIDQPELQRSLGALQNEAQKRYLHVWVGAVIFNRDGWYNTAFGFTPAGKVHLYRKVNLANAERAVLRAGDSLPLFQLETPAETFKVGVQICRELRYPEQWGWLARSGVQVFLHPDNNTQTDEFRDVWRSHLVSRAAETGRYVLSANCAAARQGCPTMIVAPDGKVLGEAVSDRLEVLRAGLDLAQVSNRILEQCRTDVVTLAPVKA